MEETHRLHGFPKVIVSEKDPKFTRIVWKELWNMSETTLSMSLAYHPQTYGQT